VLRDDLIIELATGSPATSPISWHARHEPFRLQARRSRNAGGCRTRTALRGDQCPTSTNDKDQDEQILAQLLSIALANRCAQMEVAVGLVGTTADLRHLVRWHVYGDKTATRRGSCRAGGKKSAADLLTDVLAGRIGAAGRGPAARIIRCSFERKADAQ